MPKEVFQKQRRERGWRANTEPTDKDSDIFGRGKGRGGGGEFITPLILKTFQM